MRRRRWWPWCFRRRRREWRHRRRLLLIKDAVINRVHNHSAVRGQPSVHPRQRVGRLAIRTHSPLVAADSRLGILCAQPVPLASELHRDCHGTCLRRTVHALVREEHISHRIALDSRRCCVDHDRTNRITPRFLEGHQVDRAHEVSSSTLNLVAGMIEDRNARTATGNQGKREAVRLRV